MSFPFYIWPYYFKLENRWADKLGNMKDGGRRRKTLLLLVFLCSVLSTADWKQKCLLKNDHNRVTRTNYCVALINIVILERGFTSPGTARRQDNVNMSVKILNFPGHVSLGAIRMNSTGTVPDLPIALQRHVSQDSVQILQDLKANLIKMSEYLRHLCQGYEWGCFYVCFIGFKGSY